MSYVVVAAIGPAVQKIIKKNLEYAIIVTFIDFDPDKYGARVVIVDGRLAIKLYGRIYAEL